MWLIQKEVQNIYIGEYKWWKPWANTLLYLPLKEDLLDHSQYNRTITQTGTITKDSTWYKFGASWASYLYSSNFNWPNICTLSVWSKKTWNGSYHAVVANKYYGSHRNPYITTNLIYGNRSNYIQFECVNTSNTVYSYTSNIDTYNAWHHFVWVYTWTKYYLYIDWVKNLEYNVSWNLLSTNSWFYVGDYVWDSPNQYFVWNISEVIFEDKAWTAQEISDYYNSTKAIYA